MKEINLNNSLKISFVDILGKDTENFENKYKNWITKEVFKAFHECPRTYLEVCATTLIPRPAVRSAMVELQINKDLYFVGVKDCNVIKHESPLFTTNKDFFDLVINSKNDK